MLFVNFQEVIIITIIAMNAENHITMSKGKRVRDEVPEKILKRHNEIRRRYEEMLARERAENPERLKYLSKTYFVDMICKDPVIGLSPNYVRRIINGRI